MALTAQQKREAARRLGLQLWDDGLAATADMATDDLEAAVESIDTAMDTVIGSIPSIWQSKTFKQALIDNLPEPFQSHATAAQKALALSTWAMLEAGVI